MSAIHPLPLVLASESKSRQILLTQAGLTYTYKESKIDESSITGDNPEKRATALAKAKITAIIPALEKPALILGADTVLIFDKQVIEKPRYKMDAVTIIQKLSGTTHTVITGWTIYNSYKETWYEGVSKTKVTFRPLLHQEIVAYANNNPVTEWAGGYNASLSSASGFISSIEGSLTGLNGLPIDQIIPKLVHEWAHPYKLRQKKDYLS